MKRTRTRPVVTGRLSEPHACLVGVSAGVLGFGVLLAQTNPIVSFLGLGNIFLYSGAYTYMKRTSIYNTWEGAVVGCSSATDGLGCKNAES
eukprot:m.134256 g.134256  ORF g.134256 m.134256 type:complete len:91 (-) comp52441_c0_seq24:647-919(-)